MATSTNNFCPGPEDMELVSVLMNMKAGLTLDRPSPTSVLLPITHRKLSTKDRTPRPPSIPATLCPPPCMKPLWSSGQHPSSPVISTIKVPVSRRTVGDQCISIHNQRAQQPVRYTPEQRRKAVQRYKNKKRRRARPNGQVRYEVRKRLADTRPRHRGRFFKAIPDVVEGMETGQTDM